MSPLLTLFCWIQTRTEDRKENGSVAIEYALLATLIAVAIIAAITGVGTRLITAFGRVVF